MPAPVGATTTPSSPLPRPPLEMSSISADLYGDGRDDLALFYFSKGANYATLTTTNSITSEFIPWNNNSHKKIIKGLTTPPVK